MGRVYIKLAMYAKEPQLQKHFRDLHIYIFFFSKFEIVPRKDTAAADSQKTTSISIHFSASFLTIGCESHENGIKGSLKEIVTMNLI